MSKGIQLSSMQLTRGYFYWDHRAILGAKAVGYLRSESQDSSDFLENLIPVIRDWCEYLRCREYLEIPVEDLLYI